MGHIIEEVQKYTLGASHGHQGTCCGQREWGPPTAGTGTLEAGPVSELLAG